MTKVQAYFPDELYQEAALNAKNSNSNFSELLRNAVIDYLKKQNQKKSANRFKSLRTFKSKDATFDKLKPHQLAQEIDKIVYGE